jgi:tetratricopeptide (TPR) repeat protein
MAELGRAYLLLKRHELAGPLYEELVALDGMPGGDGARLVTDLGGLALVRKTQGRADEAEALYQRALTLAEGTFGPTHPETARILTNLAVLHWEQGDAKQALSLQERALAEAGRSLGADHPQVAALRRNFELMTAGEAGGGGREPEEITVTTLDEATGRAVRTARRAEHAERSRQLSIKPGAREHGLETLRETLAETKRLIEDWERSSGAGEDASVPPASS